jgi:hypothetical protein
VKFETRHLVTYQETIFFTLPASLENLAVGLAGRATEKEEAVADGSFSWGRRPG